MFFIFLEAESWKLTTLFFENVAEKAIARAAQENDETRAGEGVKLWPQGFMSSAGHLSLAPLP